MENPTGQRVPAGAPLPAANGTGPEHDLGALRARHPGWLIDFRLFLDGYRYDARSLGDESQPRLVKATAGELEAAITRAGSEKWLP
jgi:hypothetical protein